LANATNGTVFVSKLIRQKTYKTLLQNSLNSHLLYDRNAYNRDTALAEINTVYLGTVDTNYINIAYVANYKVKSKYLIFRTDEP